MKKHVHIIYFEEKLIEEDWSKICGEIADSFRKLIDVSSIMSRVGNPSLNPCKICSYENYIHVGNTDLSLRMLGHVRHYANMSMQYTAIFHGCKNDNFQMKILDIFLIFAQNIDCGYTLEPPQRGGSNEYPQSMF